jgi:hypothetical protein
MTVLAALHAGRAAVAAGSGGYFSALPDLDPETLVRVDRLLRRALFAVLDGRVENPRDVSQEDRLRAYDVAIGEAGK